MPVLLKYYESVDMIGAGHGYAPPPQRSGHLRRDDSDNIEELFATSSSEDEQSGEQPVRTDKILHPMNLHTSTHPVHATKRPITKITKNTKTTVLEQSQLVKEAQPMPPRCKLRKPGTSKVKVAHTTETIQKMLPRKKASKKMPEQAAAAISKIQRPNPVARGG